MGFLGPVRPGWTACALQLLARTDDALGLSYLVRREVPWIKDRLVDMENPAFVGQSSTAPYLPIFLTFSFFFYEVSNNPSPRCREVVQQITTFDYMDFEAVRWLDGSMVHQWTVHGGFLWSKSPKVRQDFSDFSERAILASWRIWMNVDP